MPELISHAAVRIFPPDENGRWRIVNLNTKVSYASSRLAAMLLVELGDGGHELEVAQRFASRYGFVADEVSAAIDELHRLGLLVSPDDPSHVWCERVCSEWARYGWVDTADYQLATYDYPFADYATDGAAVDSAAMRQYVHDSPDTDRGKRYSGVVRRIPVPPTPEALRRLPVSFSTLWTGNPELELLTRDRCLTLLSATFGILRWRKLSDTPELMADASGKTSPSGGSRHPTECYLFARTVSDLDAGVYHFNVQDGTLDAIAAWEPTDDQLQRMFSGPMRASFNIDAFVVMTSVLERSMWRYREPRSFRAIYMDVGHLCGTLDVVAKALGLNCLVQHGTSEEPIAEILHIEPLVEGVIYGAAIGGAANSSGLVQSA